MAEARGGERMVGQPVKVSAFVSELLGVRARSRRRAKPMSWAGLYGWSMAVVSE